MGEDGFERARRRFDRERIEFAEELEAAEVELEAAGLDLGERLARWAEAGSELDVELRGGVRCSGLVVGLGADHLVLDEIDRGELIVRVGAIHSAVPGRRAVARRVDRHDRTIRAALREALALQRTVRVETDGRQLREWHLRAVAVDHLVVAASSHGHDERVLALAPLDVIGLGPSPLVF